MNHDKTRVWSQSGTGESRKVNRLYRRAQGGQTQKKRMPVGWGSGSRLYCLCVLW